MLGIRPYSLVARNVARMGRLADAWRALLRQQLALQQQHEQQQHEQLQPQDPGPAPLASLAPVLCPTAPPLVPVIQAPSSSPPTPLPVPAPDREPQGPPEPNRGGGGAGTQGGDVGEGDVGEDDDTAALALEGRLPHPPPCVPVWLGVVDGGSVFRLWLAACILGD